MALLDDMSSSSLIAVPDTPVFRTGDVKVLLVSVCVASVPTNDWLVLPPGNLIMLSADRSSGFGANIVWLYVPALSPVWKTMLVSPLPSVFSSMPPASCVLLLGICTSGELPISTVPSELGLRCKFTLPTPGSSHSIVFPCKALL